jgi:LysM domain
VTKSRKLIIASVLLAGGYGLAIVLSGLTDYLDPRGASTDSAQSDGVGLLATLKEFVPHHSSPPAGQLVPESSYAASQAPRSLVESHDGNQQPWNNHPTWLASTPIANVEPPAALQTEFATPPALSEYPPPQPAALASAHSAERMPRPVARITNVVGSSSDSAAGSASAWDRWPRWDPQAASPPGVAVAASFQEMEPVTPRTSSDASGSADRRSAIRSPEVGQQAEPSDVHAAQARTHIVVDGDSLSKLADRYLDDPTFADEIFRLNRDVLTDPEVLPIGVELRIPDQRMADSAALIPRGKTVEPPSLPTSMVPVEQRRPMFAGEPRAQLLRPVATGRSD